MFGADGSSIGNRNSSDGSEERDTNRKNNISIMSQDEVVKDQTSRQDSTDQNSIFSTTNVFSSQARTKRVGRTFQN